MFTHPSYLLYLALSIIIQNLYEAFFSFCVQESLHVCISTAWCSRSIQFLGFGTQIKASYK